MNHHMLFQDMLKELLKAGLSLNQLASMKKDVDDVDIGALGQKVFKEVEPHIKVELINKILTLAKPKGDGQMGGAPGFIMNLVSKLHNRNRVYPSSNPSTLDDSKTTLNDLPVDILMEIANHLDKKDQENLALVLEPAANGNQIRTQVASEVINTFLNKQENEKYKSNLVNVCLSYVIYQALITCIRAYIAEILVDEKEFKKMTFKQNRYLFYGHNINFKTSDKTVVVSYYLTAIKKDGQLEYEINYLVLNGVSFNQNPLLTKSITFFEDESIKIKLYLNDDSNKHAFMSTFLDVVGLNTISFEKIEIKMMTVNKFIDYTQITSFETIKNPVDWWNFQRERRLFLSTLSKIASSPFVENLINNFSLQGTQGKDATTEAVAKAATDADDLLMIDLIEPPIASYRDSPIPFPITNYLIRKFPSWKAVLYLQYLMHFLYGHCNKPDVDRILRNLSDHLDILYGFDVNVFNSFMNSQPPWEQKHAVLNQILVVFIDNYNRLTNGHHLVTEGNFATGNLMIHVRFGEMSSLSNTYASVL